MPPCPLRSAGALHVARTVPGWSAGEVSTRFVGGAIGSTPAVRSSVAVPLAPEVFALCTENRRWVLRVRPVNVTEVVAALTCLTGRPGTETSYPVTSPAPSCGGRHERTTSPSPSPTRVL